MRQDTRKSVDASWAGLFGIEGEELWSHVTVQPHARLEGYPGWYVAWRQDGMQQPEFWRTFAHDAYVTQLAIR